MSSIESIFFEFALSILIIWLLVSIVKRAKKLEKGIEPRGIDVQPFNYRDLLCALVLIFYFSLRIIFSAKAENTAVAPAVPHVSAIIINQITMMIPALAVFLRLKNPLISATPGWGRNLSPSSLLLWPVLGVLTIQLINYTYRATGLPQLITTFFQSRDLQTVVALLKNGPLEIQITIAVCAVIIAPVIEELMFRGYMYPAMKKFAGPLVSLFFTSLLFGLIHTNAASLLPLSVFGVVMVFLYEKTKTIWTPIIAHAFFNGATVAYILLGQWMPDFLKNL